MAYMTTAEVAELVRAPESTIRYWRHAGIGPQGFKVGRRVLYDSADVHAWVQGLHSAAATAETAKAS